MPRVPFSPFGPNGRLVERFLDRLSHMRPDDFAPVVQRWRETLRRTDAWYGAEDAVGDAIAQTRRDTMMWVVQDRLYAIFRGTPWYTSERPATPAEMATQYLATTAAVALLVADALPAAQLSTLYAPFAELIPLADVALGSAPFAEPRGRVERRDVRDGLDVGDDEIRH